jgi:hypothetical protein
VVEVFSNQIVCGVAIRGRIRGCGAVPTPYLPPKVDPPSAEAERIVHYDNASI